MKRLSTVIKAKRKALYLSGKELSKRACVPETLVSGLQNDSRKIGEVQATRIGKALGLSGNELQEFVYVALNESKGRLLNSSKIYCAEILNYLPNLIATHGIGAEEIVDAVILEEGIALTLENGSTATVSASVVLN
jgi:transcriptional regulator with XRE-family HTH domain